MIFQLRDELPHNEEHMDSRRTKEDVFLLKRHLPEKKGNALMKQLWTRVLLILVIAICTVGAGMVATTRAQAGVGGGGPPATWQVTCHVHFLDGPNQGKTEPVTFAFTSHETMTASSSEYVGSASNVGTWQYSDSTAQAVFFTFTAPLASPPSTTLTVTTTIAISTTTVVGTSQGTITNSSGTVLGVAHTTTTCPSFLPPNPCSGIECAENMPPADKVIL